MKLAIIAFTANGLALTFRIEQAAARMGHESKAYLKSKYTGVPEGSCVIQVEEKLSVWAEEVIPAVDGVIFVGATGIAVRTIAPFVKSKKTDPAVVVLDEKGSFVISLLSGHLGGANRLTEDLARELHAVPVITTATDVNHRFAVDVFAKNNGMTITDMRLAKEVSALILQDVPLKMGCGAGYQEKPASKRMPVCQQDAPDGIRATFWIQLPDGEVLHLVPENITLGIGCKKGTSAEQIEGKVRQVLKEQGILPAAIRQAASIDLKKNEAGLLGFCEKWKLPFLTYTGEELGKLDGDFTPSAFVSSITGVDNVCERSAYLASGRGILLVRKQAGDGITVACAVKDWSVDFE